MSIKKIKINNFRNITNLDLDLDNTKIVCFVGENGSSKTSVLSLIFEGLIFNTKYSYNDLDSKNLNRNRTRLLSQNEIQKNKLFYSSQIFYENFDKELIKYKKLVLLNETINNSHYKDIIDINVNYGTFFNEISNLNNLKNEFLKHNVLLYRPSYRHEIYSMDLMTEDTYKVETDTKIQNERPFNIKSISTGNNTQNILLNLLFDLFIGYKDREWALTKMQKILTEITNKDYGHVQITKSPYRELIFSNACAVKQLSHGELEILSTITAIIEQQVNIQNEFEDDIDIFDIPGIVIIDEVDLHLHPKAQEKYLKVLNNIFKNIQFIVSTHSPFVIRGLPEKSIVISLPDCKKYLEDFKNMDIDSITEIIFNFNGSFSFETNEKIKKFKNNIILEKKDLVLLKDIYNELKNSLSAKNELKFLMTSYINEKDLIDKIIEE